MKARLRSLSHAIRGVSHLLRFEHNARLHLFFAVIAVALGIWLHISAVEWLVVILCIGFVISAELFNTAIEVLADQVTHENNKEIGDVKDMSAAGVLIAALAAVVAGLVIFGPKLLALALFT